MGYAVKGRWFDQNADATTAVPSCRNTSTRIRGRIEVGREGGYSAGSPVGLEVRRCELIENRVAADFIQNVYQTHSVIAPPKNGAASFVMAIDPGLHPMLPITPGRGGARPLHSAASASYACVACPLSSASRANAAEAATQLAERPRSSLSLSCCSSPPSLVEGIRGSPSCGLSSDWQ